MLWLLLVSDSPALLAGHSHRGRPEVHISAGENLSSRIYVLARPGYPHHPVMPPGHGQGCH